MASRSIARTCSQLSASSPSSAARAFLQLAPRRYLHSTPPPVLDFLLPSLPSTLIRKGWAAQPQSRPAQPVKRTFASSSRCQQTTAIFNPRQDDDGNDMGVEITPRASNRLKEIMSQDSNPNLALRIQVESGGCHGFQYLMSLTTLPLVDAFSSGSTQTESPPVLNASSDDPNEMPSKTLASAPLAESDGAKPGKLDEFDTVFAANDGSGAKVVMDGPSLDLLKGSKIDYTMELIGSQFKIVDNPLATSSCGCGTSFDIKA